MIKYSEKPIKIINAGTKAISIVYYGYKKVWQLNKEITDLIKSCFAQGYWINSYGWTNDQGWKNN